MPTCSVLPAAVIRSGSMSSKCGQAQPVLVGRVVLLVFAFSFLKTMVFTNMRWLPTAVPSLQYHYKRKYS
ncbi:hypothetical protein Bca101_010552 [Brassica carinata]